ncbi:hypothetical protein GJ629_03780 [Halapricum sp. CBA1109]|uniref:hypothetical protein n=1 Tax=Halapricum sp. CBA1109 TaxID=2668068 RepID=UPI0012F88633|nr:hypothetical protein [Halapricum sp. CBA1109]MUV89129.1 hypothetical protein [Halapricum sp. CBA1109]
MTAVGVGVITALAGCSGNGSDGGGEPSPEDGDQPDSETQTEQSTDTESTPDQEHTETSTEASSGDTVYDGEEDFEEWLSSHEMDAVPESHWMEFEDPENHFELPLTEYVDGNSPLTYNIQEKKRGEGLGQYDSLYIAVTKDSADELQFAPLYFTEDEWDTSMSARENMQEVGRFIVGGYTPISEGDLETFFEEDVLSYDDISEDFPQEYLDLVNQ